MTDADVEMMFIDVDDVRSLDGEWQVTRAGGDDPIAATVPGVVHYDLIAAGELGNPFASTAAATAAHGVSASEWRYERTFVLSAADLGSEWMLEFDGIDTFAEVLVNGERVGSSANALRAARFELPPAVLREGTNVLVVVIGGHLSGVEHMLPEARRRLRHDGPIEGLLGKSLLRRYPRSFFSMSSLLNLGTGVLGLGINGPVRLRRVGELRVHEVFAQTLAADAHTADLRFTVELSTVRDAQLVLTLTDPDGGAALTLTSAVEAGSTSLVLEGRVQRPRMWWPVGYGAADLYRVRVALAARGAAAVAREAEIGIRTVELRRETEAGRPTFQFVVNGTPVWVRGTNYIPVDYLKVRGDEKQYERVFALLESGNNNMVRMWGGGAPESDAWYRECDRRGILVWQDFYLHSNTYPDYDEVWVAEFAREAEELIRRVRPHASLALLCGGNEQWEGWDEWHWRETLERFFGESLVTEIIPSILDRLDTGVPYVLNSPYGGAFVQSPVEGDAHVWGNHFNSTKDPLFVSETCWGQESYSRPETLAEIMDLDVDEFVGPDWPKRWAERTSLPLVLRFPYTGYHSTGGLRTYLKDLEVEQALADYHSLSNFRLRAPSCRGFLYWSFNKGGPLFQFGAVDYGLRPMMSHFVVGRLNRDVVVGAYRDTADIRVVASNGTADPVEVTVDVAHLDRAGVVLGRWEKTTVLTPGAPCRLIDLDGLYDAVVDRRAESVHVRLTHGTDVLSDDHLLFCPFAEFVPGGAQLSAVAQRTGERSWSLRVESASVSKMVQIEGCDGLILDQNYFPLVAGRPVDVRIVAPEGVDIPDELTLAGLDDSAMLTVSLPH